MEAEQIPIGKFGFIKAQVLDWVSSHLGWVVSGFLGAMVVLFGAGQWFSKAEKGSQADYLAAEIAFLEWQSSKAPFEKFEKLVQAHSDLRARYSGVMAQYLLEKGERVGSVATPALKRLGSLAPYYAQFSKGSLLIGEGKLAEALGEAKALKEAMGQDAAFWEKKGQGSLLYAYNLLRIGALEQSVGSPDGEILAWQELKENAGWEGSKPALSTYDPEAYLALSKNFQKYDVSLLDYIKYREAQLNATSSLAP